MLSIIYAHRNRDTARIKASFLSLSKQELKNFEVIFIDYGSEPCLVRELKEIIKDFNFVKLYPLQVSNLLWNKSKALNFGILRSSSPYIFIADVDLIFHPDTTKLFNKLAVEKKFFLFKLGYLGSAESQKLFGNYNFEDLKPYRYGEVNGMILASKKAYVEVNGLDEFFHFYGSEDEDLFARMENAGYKRENDAASFFYHNWHQSFAGSEEKFITENPRVKNIMRINQRHYLIHKDKDITRPLRQTEMGMIISKKQSDLLEKPTVKIRMYNIQAHVEHFLREELPSYKDEIIKVEINEDPYFQTLKYKVKKLIGRQTQTYISMKKINDMILKEILFSYRNHNYSFKVNENLKTILFCIQL
ncbi:MAG: glycosyltransferase [Gillisia sp.]